MKYHVLTVALLLMALVLYVVGMRSGGAVAFVVGAACELWFWVRLIRGRREAPRTATSVDVAEPRH